MKLIISIYFVIQILVLSSLMVLQIKLTLHSILMTLACMLYLLVSFKKPGYYISNIKLPHLSDEINDSKNIKKPQMKQIGQVNQDQQYDKISIHNRTLKLENCKSQYEQQGEIQQRNKNKYKSENLIVDKKKGNRKVVNNKSQAQNQNKPKQKQQQMFQKNKNQIHKNTKNNSKQFSRYCRICMVLQPLRVRHCHQCDQCIYTFDHHCPWMDNCIGQKNRLYFWLFLLIQSIQFLCIDISVLNQISSSLQYKHAYFFFIGLLIVSLVSFALLGFHTFLIVKNLTTWEYVRWNKIQYLKKFMKRQSPFSFKWKNNLYDYFISSWQQQPFQWIINNQIEKNKLKNKRQVKIKINQNLETQRGISKLQQ